MTIDKLTTLRLSDFLAFCRSHRDAIDESFLSDDDLRDFVPDAENPTYVAVGDQDAIIGAASLMNGPYYQRGRKGRFRIFHVLPPHLRGIYADLLAHIAPDVPAMDDLYLFVRDDNALMRAVLESLDFSIERYAYFMRREPGPVTAPQWDEGYVLRPLVFNRDEGDYCRVRNLGFSRLVGSQTPVTPDEVSRMQDAEDYLEAGIFLLYHDDTPVGVARTSKDTLEGESVLNIGPLALVPGYQGKGLGRQLLRAALSFGHAIGLATAVLSANVDNENAIRLYVSEGFAPLETMVCYSWRRPT